MYKTFKEKVEITQNFTTPRYTNPYSSVSICLVYFLDSYVFL